jgi:hypothetical protein
MSIVGAWLSLQPGAPSFRVPTRKQAEAAPRPRRAFCHGDPAAALLEVLDPEQNGAFRDHYLDVPFDLSRVVFVTTANNPSDIPGPLRDRTEVITHPGYTSREKFEIARRHLVQRQLLANGLKPGQAEITDEALRALVEKTTEPGVRELQREIASAAQRSREGGQGDGAPSANTTADCMKATWYTPTPSRLASFAAAGELGIIIVKKERNSKSTRS